ncbi:class I SAM-dependent methyltransferase [Brevibacterium jeotgali]|uniref:16S rRNA m(2)G 1207 methyltransferase n=1 Tax=Brevibacterium jeotgali TaxID=1262550 RepID=A0A2H1L363_9MICO|nr:methyltransferase [Brevibacterium jeotgali]TWC02550.1 16S rRNA m(2)G 1207 methyltransferase [Brevibacterium jeotgali]SMY11342.1 16S rRNA m(2)G 1207 methyltransferase [Brevibacterium jeotgali]
MADHYFSAAPASAAERRGRTVRLAGRDVDVTTAGGVFSPEHVDTGTRVLLDHVPEPPSGDLLDLGCGWGPISLDAALRARGADSAVRVWALDVNERALQLTADNAAALGLTNVNAVTVADVPADLGFSAIWSNPPIRVGKAVLHDMLLTWLPRLEPGASAHLVAAKKLGADSLLRWLDSELGAEFSAERTATAKGFRVLRVDRAA